MSLGKFGLRGTGTTKTFLSTIKNARRMFSKNTETFFTPRSSCLWEIFNSVESIVVDVLFDYDCFVQYFQSVPVKPCNFDTNRPCSEIVRVPGHMEWVEMTRPVFGGKP